MIAPTVISRVRAAGDLRPHARQHGKPNMKTWTMVGLALATIFVTVPLSPQVTRAVCRSMSIKHRLSPGHARRVNREWIGAHRQTRRAVRRGVYWLALRANETTASTCCGGAAAIRRIAIWRHSIVHARVDRTHGRGQSGRKSPPAPGGSEDDYAVRRPKGDAATRWVGSNRERDSACYQQIAGTGVRMKCAFPPAHD